MVLYHLTPSLAGIKLFAEDIINAHVLYIMLRCRPLNHYCKCHSSSKRQQGEVQHVYGRTAAPWHFVLLAIEFHPNPIHWMDLNRVHRLTALIDLNSYRIWFISDC